MIKPIKLMLLYLCIVMLVSSCTKHNNKNDLMWSHFGGRTLESVMLAFESIKNKSYLIFSKYLKNDPDFRGALLFHVIVQPNGEVSSAKITSNTTGSKKFAAQILSLIRKLKFNDENVNEAVFDYKFEYSPHPPKQTAEK